MADVGGKRKIRFGIGEWYARLFLGLSSKERLENAEAAQAGRLDLPCPPKHSCAKTNPKAVPGKLNCNKKGGVCSIREYEQKTDSSFVALGHLRVTCPIRFLQDAVIFEWIGDTILGTRTPVVVKEIEFLESSPDEPEEVKEIGYIDNVLVRPFPDRFDWCALEIQAVYFSGTSMAVEYAQLKDARGAALFPAGDRHPDYRSSGPKRLMPQLQIKVPSLRRWGKKMAVVVDEDFFASLGHMDEVRDVSNSDIVWFVMRLKEEGKLAKLEPAFVKMTTLERAVEGLTGGIAVSLKKFEERIVRRVKQNYPDVAIPSPVQ